MMKSEHNVAATGFLLCFYLLAITSPAVLATQPEIEKRLYLQPEKNSPDIISQLLGSLVGSNPYRRYDGRGGTTQVDIEGSTDTLYAPSMGIVNLMNSIRNARNKNTRIVGSSIRTGNSEWTSPNIDLDRRALSNPGTEAVPLNFGAILVKLLNQVGGLVDGLLPGLLGSLLGKNGLLTNLLGLGSGKGLLDGLLGPKGLVGGLLGGLLGPKGLLGGLLGDDGQGGGLLGGLLGPKGLLGGLLGGGGGQGGLLGGLLGGGDDQEGLLGSLLGGGDQGGLLGGLLG